MNLTRYNKIMKWLSAALVISFFCAKIFTAKAVVIVSLILFVVLVIVIVVLSIYLWRCPYCDWPLPRSSFQSRIKKGRSYRCPNCKNDIEFF